MELLNEYVFIVDKKCIAIGAIIIERNETKKEKESLIRELNRRNPIVNQERSMQNRETMRDAAFHVTKSITKKVFSKKANRSWEMG